jgi:hypothetical protein
MKFYNRAGQVIDLQKWAFLSAKNDYVGIDLTEIGPDVRVSTIWVGIDYGPGHPFPPMIYETMVFDRREPYGTTGENYRYPTEESAIAGHLAVCETVQNRLAAEQN